MKVVGTLKRSAPGRFGSSGTEFDVWMAHLPGLSVRPHTHNGRETAEIAVLDQVGTDSFVPLEEFPPLLCREMPAVSAALDGRVVARVLRADPEQPWPHPPWSRRTTGVRISLLASGTAWFDLAGIGEESFSANDSWCLPGGFEYSLLEASTDFELLEIDFPDWLGEDGATDVPEVSTLFATYRWQPTQAFGGAEAVTGPPATSEHRDDSRWVRPWRVRGRGIECAYLTGGAARLEVERLGVIDARSGTFWLWAR